mgnify:CR=1 FL=1
MNIPQTSPTRSFSPTAMAWCTTNRFWSLLTPNIRRSLYLQSKDSRLSEKFELKDGGNFVDTIKRVQDLMQVRDMNLCVLAKKCGISYSTIQTTARRGGQLSVETIERICQGLGITLKDFFDSSYL